MLKIGTIVDGRYEILKEIGRGGMSVVYLAMDNRLNKSLVVKDIRKRKGKDNELLINSLVVEANMLKRLEHHALPRIYDIIESKGDIYVVMDYIEGQSLKEVLDSHGRLPAKDVIKWARQLSDVLDYLHTREPPIVYRDMKPDNIMLTPNGKIKLIDFGIAREYKVNHSTDTVNLGTKGYASPEQLSGKQTDARTDIYSLGVTLYHLVTGRSLSEPPFEVRPIRQWDASLPEGLEHIIHRCTQTEPDQRYQSCAELSYDLANIDKLTQGYKKKLYQRLVAFIIPFLFFFVFSTTTILGYNGMRQEQFEHYVDLINQARSELIDGNDSRAIQLMEAAIEEDNRRAEAYINILNIYINRGDVDSGLDKLEQYINQGYGRIDTDDNVLFKVGMTYFDLKRDYSRALHYFRQINEEVLPDVIYYKTLATTLSSLNIEYQAFSEELHDLEAYTDSLPNDQKKIDNYQALANIYLSYKAQIDQANTRAIDILEKANELLTILNDETLSIQYQELFIRNLAQAYYSRGIENDAIADFEQAIDYYSRLLEEGIANEERVRITIGSIYQEMGRHSLAIAQFEQIIDDNPDLIEGYVRLANLLIDLEQERDEVERSYQAARDLYEQANEQDGATEHENLQRLRRRLENLSVL
ncbi:serine/threonine protein kinase [Amphibacillus marinus]|uniref:non-specific serine/threonine protein kinase n=1 Tax=Amphibacillus marinus TaxID=872970 RepID=A0A1H8R454_9BACI|nr:serine/threonine-protein kinase [Amphibacillus marinus]SEO61091.1 serine/threonine protein kinase [Amphibacillus marinus]